MGSEVVTKPSRSDEVLDADQQLKITQEAKAHFESLAPKRPKKPARSEASSFPDYDHPPADDDPETTIPELTKFQSLQSQSQIIILEGGGAAVHEEEFVETEYYKKLNSIDKQHHTTGSGFIRVDGPRGGGGVVSLQERSSAVAVAAPVKSNPATNDWIPTMDEVVFVSSKPARSESCL